MYKQLQVTLLLFALSTAVWSAPCAVSPQPAAARLLDTTFIEDAAQDGGGQVWGAEGSSGAGRLRTWQKDQWQIRPMSFAKDYEPQMFSQGANGRVLCLWEAASGSGVLVSAHAGGKSRLLARVPLAIRGDSGYEIAPSFYAERDGGAWIAGQSDTFWHLSPSGSVQAFPLPSTWFLPGRTSQEQHHYHDRIGSVLDGQGRRWFWSNDMDIDVFAACLRGVLLWDGKSLTSHPKLPGVPDKPFSVIATEDARHLWLAVPQDGLYEVDISTLHGNRVKPPEHGAFQTIEGIFQVGDDCYLADGPATPDERSVVLWRRRKGAARWVKVIPGLDKSSNTDFHQSVRPRLATPAGLWVGAFGGGAWWLPAQHGPAVPMDWRRGFPLSVIHELFSLPDSRVLAVGEASTVLASRLPPLLHQPSPSLRTFLTAFNLPGLVSDPHHHLWGVLVADAHLLSEWDGQAWRKASYPQEHPPGGVFLVCAGHKRAAVAAA